MTYVSFISMYALGAVATGVCVAASQDFDAKMPRLVEVMQRHLVGASLMWPIFAPPVLFAAGLSLWEYLVVRVMRDVRGLTAYLFPRRRLSQNAPTSTYRETPATCPVCGQSVDDAIHQPFPERKA